MKKEVLLLFLFFLFLSCNDDNNKLVNNDGEEKQDETIEETIEEKYDKPSALSLRLVSYPYERSNLEKIDSLWSSGDNIKQYNATTGELKFYRNPSVNFLFLARDYYLDVFLENKKIITFPCPSPLLSTIVIHSPCFLWDVIWENGGYVVDEDTGFSAGRYYISNGYPILYPNGEREEYYDPWWGSSWALIDSVRKENWKAIEPEWNIIIEQLKKEGKYIE